MRNVVFQFLLLKQLVASRFSPAALNTSATNVPLHFFSSSRRLCREAPEICYGLNWGLAGRGVIVKDKAFWNLKPCELQQKGATLVEPLSGLPFYVRGDVMGGFSNISKAQFMKLLKQVTTHLSSILDIFVHDGAIGLSQRCNAKVRIISDSSSPVLSLSSLLWATATRAVSHDSCPLTVYSATSISPSSGDVVGLGVHINNGFIVADIERSSLILCGEAFTDSKSVKQALSALAGPIILSRRGLLLSAGLLAMGDSVVLLFASYGAIRSCSDLLVSRDAGVILSSEGVYPVFASSKSAQFSLPKLPAAVVILSCDSSGAIPCISKLTPGQAAYHFLAGYQNGKFVPTYSEGPSAIRPLDLAKAFLYKIKDNHVRSFLVNMSEREKEITGKELTKLVRLALSEEVPSFEFNGRDLEKKYKRFLSSLHKELPEEFSL